MNDEELISAYVDGRMSEPERAAFEARLQADAALRRQVAVTRLLVDQSRQVENVPSPKNFILPQDFGKAARPATPAPKLNFRLLFFRLGSIAAAVVFMFAVAFDALRTTLPAAPVPAAAPMAATMQEAQAPKAGITSNTEPVVPTVSAKQAPAAGAAVMPEATPQIEARSMMTEAQSAADQAVPSSAASVADADGSAPSAKSMPAPMPATQAYEVPAAQPAPTQPESLLSPLRIIAGVALLIAVVLGLLGWLRK